MLCMAVGIIMSWGARVLVLVLEQDPAQSMRACDVLRSAGIEVAGSTAHTAEAWNLANARRPSWVLVHHQDGGERFVTELLDELGVPSVLVCGSSPGPLRSPVLSRLPSA